ncbi:MAG: hypothetical protein V5A45_01300 [Haloarculaceae archaeon]
MSGGSGESKTGPLAGIDGRLAKMRTDARQRRLALGGAIVLGLVAVAFHWVGLFVAGALVGLTRRSLPRALVAGLAFGVLVVAVFFVATPVISPGNVLVLAPLSYVTVGIALVGPVWGALARGVV